MTDTFPDLDRLRTETPGCAERIHLNNAGAGLMPDPVIQTIQEYIHLESRIGGYEATAVSQEPIAQSYTAVADLIGAGAHEIAFTENATASFAQAVSSIPFEPGDVILTTRNDYVSNQLQFLALERRLGIRVLRAPDGPEGGLDIEVMASLIEAHRPKLVSVTHVPTSSGLVQDIAAVGALCRSDDIIYLVDACQSVGQLSLDVKSLGCDFLSATARKFLRGPRGSGFLYVSERLLAHGLEPLFIDLRGADWTGDRAYQPVADAKRFENWEFAYALVLGTGEAARYASAIGIDRIEKRVTTLADRLRRALADIPGVRILDHAPRLCAIVSIWIEGRDQHDVMQTLRQRGINTTAQDRVDATLHYDDRDTHGALRLSPHYYNTDQEIDQAIAAIEELATAKA